MTDTSVLPYGEPIELMPGLRCILARNPSPMTLHGTNTYLLGTRDIAVIDPGPADAAHLRAILQAVHPGQCISHILVTHSHLDHAPLAGPLAQATGAPVLAFGDASAGRSEVMQELAASGMVGGGEGIDHDFAPDIKLPDGAVVAAEGWSLEVLHTPGHLGNHICLAWRDCCFTADHVMGWASSLVSPPDGDLTDFMASCARLQRRHWRRFFSGHGAPIDDPAGRLQWLVAHRRAREAAILRAVESGPLDATAVTARVYTDTPPALLPAARRNVLAHLIDLYGQNAVRADGPLTADTTFRGVALDAE